MLMKVLLALGRVFLAQACTCKAVGFPTMLATLQAETTFCSQSLEIQKERKRYSAVFSEFIAWLIKVVPNLRKATLVVVF